MKTVPTNIDNQENLIDELHTLLEKQVQMLRNSKFLELEKLIEKTGAITTEIAQNPSLLTPELKDRSRQIHNLYKKLELMIATEKDAVDKQLQKVNCGKRTLRTYHEK